MERSAPNSWNLALNQTNPQAYAVNGIILTDCPHYKTTTEGLFPRAQEQLQLLLTPSQAIFPVSQQLCGLESPDKVSQSW